MVSGMKENIANCSDYDYGEFLHFPSLFMLSKGLFKCSLSLCCALFSSGQFCPLFFFVGITGIDSFLIIPCIVTTAQKCRAGTLTGDKAAGNLIYWLSLRSSLCFLFCLWKTHTYNFFIFVIFLFYMMGVECVYCSDSTLFGCLKCKNFTLRPQTFIFLSLNTVQEAPVFHLEGFTTQTLQLTL